MGIVSPPYVSDRIFPEFPELDPRSEKEALRLLDIIDSVGRTANSSQNLRNYSPGRITTDGHCSPPR